MRSAGLRNKPIDRRYLNARDRSDYNQSGEYSSHASALSKARARRGQQSYQQRRPMNTQGRTPGTGGFGGGIQVQQKRLAEYGQSRKSEFQIKPPSNKGDIFGDKKQ